MDTKSNPFSSLCNSYEKIEKLTETKNKSLNETQSTDAQRNLTSIIEQVFLITLDNGFKESKSRPNMCIFIGDTDESEHMDLDNLDVYLIKRLQTKDINNSLLRFNKQSCTDQFKENEVCEQREYFYIYSCFKRLLKHRFDDQKTFDYLLNMCFNLCRTIIELGNFDEEYWFSQIIDLFFLVFDDKESTRIREFANGFFKTLEQENDNGFVEKLFYWLNEKYIELDQCNYYSADFFKYIDILQLLFNNSANIKDIFLKSCFPKQRNIGKNWQVSNILGKLLQPHYLQPEITSYFQNPTGLTQNDINGFEQQIWTRQNLINQKHKQLIKILIRESINRQLLLEWFGECIYVNTNRSQEWLKYSSNNNNEHASDGFFLNILFLFLDLSQPFCDNIELLPKIDLSYSIVSTDKTKSFKSIHFLGFDKDTKFLKFDNQNLDRNAEIDVKNEYNFITECFYATHRLYQISFEILNQKLIKINQELVRIQGIYSELRETQQFNENNFEHLAVKNAFEKYTIDFLNIKSVLTQTNLNEMCLKFIVATSNWLIDMRMRNRSKNCKLELTNIIDILRREKQPNDDFNRYLLSLVPECFLTNLTQHLIFLSRFKNNAIDLISNYMEDDHHTLGLNSIITLICAFMGHSGYLVNPHCRAALAECLETLLPNKTSKHTDALFVKHACAPYLSDALLNVFVSIEMTGQSVQFEQKFNYRRPMYEILEYLWTIDLHRKKLEKMAKHALDNLENTEQPLFLRFSNLLINDANYLLLEGLLYLEKIKLKQQEFKFIQQHERAQVDANLKHMIMLAKFHNLMSLKTIRTLKLLTTSQVINNLFCNNILIDRIASMLNDFLLHFVGPKKNSLKVNNFKEVEFNPQEIVSIICDIYLNLSSVEDFCKAVCRDGRSYSKELFPCAITVLKRINRPFDMVEQFACLGQRIEEISRVQSLEDSNYDDAPDDFMDPIMSSLMVDPVILPTSKKSIDRSTIARHLLSDQTDPFNRTPLSLQDVIPDIELKKRIEEWKESKRNKSRLL